MNFLRLAQGWNSSLFFANMATSLTFSIESLKIFLDENPQYKIEPFFNITEINDINYLSR